MQINHFALEFEQCCDKYTEKFALDLGVDDFPQAGFNMHYQIARLHLGHLVFHRLHGTPVPSHFLPVAYSASSAAMALFAMILDVDILRENLIGVPHYVHVMMALAGQLILEVCMKHKHELRIKVEAALQLISAVLGHFVRMPTLPHHPLTRVTAGLMRRLSACTTSLGMDSVMTGPPFGALPEPYLAALHPDHEPQTSTEFAAQFPGDEDEDEDEYPHHMLPMTQDPFAGFCFDDMFLQSQPL